MNIEGSILSCESRLMFPADILHMNAVEEAWCRSKPETLVCEYPVILDGIRMGLFKYPGTARFNLDLFKYLKARLADGNYICA